MSSYSSYSSHSGHSAHFDGVQGHSDMTLVSPSERFAAHWRKLMHQEVEPTLVDVPRSGFNPWSLAESANAYRQSLYRLFELVHRCQDSHEATYWQVSPELYAGIDYHLTIHEAMAYLQQGMENHLQWWDTCFAGDDKVTQQDWLRMAKEWRWIVFTVKVITEELIRRPLWDYTRVAVMALRQFLSVC